MRFQSYTVIILTVIPNSFEPFSFLGQLTLREPSWYENCGTAPCFL
jgi:hypothetical protein